MLPVASLIILGVATGCGPKTPEPVPTPAPMEQVQVRLDALVPLHPLTPELARMDETMRRLENLARTKGVKQPSPAATTRPNKDLVPVTAGILQKEDARVRKAHRTFRATAETELAEFGFELDRRRDAREVQRRAVLEAILFGELADRERLTRIGIEDAVASQLAAGAMTYTNLTAKRGALTNDITSPGLNPPLLPPLIDEQDLRAELELLAQDPKAKNVSDRARLTRDLNEVDRQTEAFLAEERRLEAEAAKDLAAALRELRRGVNEKIEQQLAQERKEADDDSLVEEQQEAMANTLAFDTEVRETLGKAGAEMPTGGDLPVSSLFGAGLREPNQLTNVSVGAQVARLRMVRDRLAALIRQDLAEAVRDAAQTRNIDVQMVEGDGKGVVKGIVRKDQTESFKSWIRPLFQTRRGGGRT